MLSELRESKTLPCPAAIRYTQLTRRDSGLLEQSDEPETSLASGLMVGSLSRSRLSGTFGTSILFILYLSKMAAL